MINTLWRFGDSWSTTQDHIYGNIESNHSQYIADYFEMNLVHLGNGGYSNLEIFNRILQNTHNYKPNDIILINFTSIARVSVIDGSDIICTANGGDTVFKSKVLMNVISNNVGEPISNILFYLIKSYIDSLIHSGIRVYHFYNDDSNVDCPFKIKNKLIFKNSIDEFMGWCKENGYEDLTPTGNVHYTLGSQQKIADKIIELIQSL